MEISPEENLFNLQNEVRRRAGHVAVCYKGKIYIWGGYMEKVKDAPYNLMTQSSVKYHEPRIVCVYEPLLNIWYRKSCSGSIPFHLSGSFFTNSENFLYVFGGFCSEFESNREGCLNILWKLDLDNFIWERINPKGCLPYPADKGASWFYKNRYYIFGGFGCTDGFPRAQAPYSKVNYVSESDFGTRGWFDQLAYYDEGLDEWVWPKWTGSPPSPRAAHAAAVVGDSVYIFGGRHGEHRLNDLHVLNMVAHTWRIVDICGISPIGRSWHTFTAISETQLVVYGGFSTECQVLNDVWCFDVKTEKWLENTWIKPYSRLWHCTVKSGPAEVTCVGGISNDLLNNETKEHAEDMLCIRFSPQSLFRLVLDFISNHTEMFPISRRNQILTPFLSQLLLKRVDPSQVHGL